MSSLLLLLELLELLLELLHKLLLLWIRLRRTRNGVNDSSETWKSCRGSSNLLLNGHGIQVNCLLDGGVTALPNTSKGNTSSTHKSSDVDDSIHSPCQWMKELLL